MTTRRLRLNSPKWEQPVSQPADVKAYYLTKPRVRTLSRLAKGRNWAGISARIIGSKTVLAKVTEAVRDAGKRIFASAEKQLEVALDLIAAP